MKTRRTSTKSGRGHAKFGGPMELLSSSNEVSRALIKLMKDYDSFYWAVAWATVAFPAYSSLENHSHKARKIVIGTHFYQTHPDFIKKFSNNKAFRYFYDIASVAGVFHPKVFLFQKGAGELAAIVGSANFTQWALNRNREICLLVTERDQLSGQLLRTLKQQIENLWEDATPFPMRALPAYRDRWKRRRWASSKGDAFGKGSNARSALEIDLLNLSWPEIYEDMRNTKWFDERLHMLRRVRSFFHPMVRFAE